MMEIDNTTIVKAIIATQKHMDAIKLIFNDIIIRYTTNNDMLIISSLFSDDFIDEHHMYDSNNVYDRVVGTVITYTFKTADINIIHNVKINDWVDKYMKNSDGVSTELINLAYISII